MTATSSVFSVGTVFPLATISKVKLPEGYRLSRITFKGKGKKGTAEYKAPEREAVGVFVPVSGFNKLQLCLNNSTLQDHFIEVMQGLEDACIREASATNSSIGQYMYDVEAIAKHVAATSVTAGRISAEAVGAWFDDELAPALAAAMAEKTGQATDSAIITAKLAAYRVQFCNMAKRDFAYGSDVYPMLEKVIVLAAESDRTEKILTKFVACAPVSAADLGF